MTESENIPWKTLSSDEGDAPFYVIQFDKHGKCTSPKALELLIETSKSKTDIFLFSHGWNNDWAAATSRYERFVEQFANVRRKHWTPSSRPFSPVLVGVFWPSAALVASSERGPDIAPAGLDDPDVAALADELPPDQAAAFQRIVGNPSYGVEALAKTLAPVVRASDDLESGSSSVSPDELAAVWRALREDQRSEPRPKPGGFIDDRPAEGKDAPDVAGGNPVQQIRDAVRATTVWLMKDRAGRVGGTGVADMLRELADASTKSRISLIGHSYGAKVVLSALCNGPAPRRPIDSVLLLQPALSCLAFASNDAGGPGGYRAAFDRVRLPIITTFSRNDEPLTKYFHLAVRRKSDLREAVIAGPGQPPSKYAALGGFGPYGVNGEVERLDMPAVGQAYPLSTGRRIIAVDGTQYISSHGAVETPETAWALLNQVQS